MAMDDLFKALQMFNGGLKELQLGRVLSNANETVEQIRASDADAKEKRAQIKGIADQLTMKMVGLGGSIEGAKGIAEMLEGPKAPQVQSAGQLLGYGLMNNDESAIKAGAQWMQTEQDIKAQSEARAFERSMIRTDFTQDRMDDRQQVSASNNKAKEARATLTKYQQDYRKDVKSLDESLQFARNGMKLLESGGDAAKIMGAIPFMAARASGSNSQLSDGERAALSGLQDYYSKFKQLVSEKARSEYIAENKAAFKDLFNVYIQGANERKVGLADTYTGQLKTNPFFVDKDYDGLITELTGGRIKKYTGPGIEREPAPTQAVNPQAPVAPAAPQQNATMPGKAKSWFTPLGK